MKPSILKVFSTYPSDQYKLPDFERKYSNNVKISHFDSVNKYQNKTHSLYDITDDDYNNDGYFSTYDDKYNDEYAEGNNDWNVLEAFNKFQEQRNANIDNKRFKGSSAQLRQNSFERPNYSYTQLIYMAIENTHEKALTVSDIYTWCEQNFPYYAHAINGWKNSLRHNLSINKCFKKITKLGVGGRGSLWIIDPRERQHLMSTMNRSNISSFKPAMLVQTNYVTEDDPPVKRRRKVKMCEKDEELENMTHIEEKPRQEWTDTRLDDGLKIPCSPSCHSVTSDTDHNDWQRSATSLIPIYPVKTHWYNQCLGIPCPPSDHNYCLPEVDELLNNPSMIVRHSFFTSADRIESFSASSDFNDDVWPKTPSPSSLNADDFNYNFSEPSMLFTHFDFDESTTCVSKKRGRPRKTELVSTDELIKFPRTDELSHSVATKPSRNSNTDRINNMYNLNAFFDSL